MSESGEQFAGELPGIGSAGPVEYLGTHLRDIFLLALQLVGTRAEAQELTQEAFITVLQRYRGTQEQEVIARAVQNTAIGAAIQLLRRTALQSARIAGRKVNRRSLRDADRAGELPPRFADLRWGERVLVLLREAQSLPLPGIAALLECPIAAARQVLARSRLREVADQPLFEQALPPPHPALEELALLIGRDGLPVSQLRARLHVRGCQICKARCAELKEAQARTRQAASDELRALDGLVDWRSLEPEMSGNITVGIAAARCIEHVRKRRSRGWKVTLLAVAVSALLAAGWMTHIPVEQTPRLFATLRQAFSGGIRRGRIVAGSAPGMLFVANSAQERLAMIHPAGAAVRVDGSGGISATFADPVTGAIVREAVSPRPANGGAGTAPVPRGNESRGEPAFQVSVPAGSPLVLENFEFGPQGPGNVQLAMALRNSGNKTIAAVTFRLESRPSGQALASSIAVQGLTAEPGQSIPLRATFGLPAGNHTGAVNLALDCVLFTDLTSYGPDIGATRLTLAADEIAGTRERTFLQQSIAGGELAAVRRELDFGLDPTPQGAAYDVVDVIRSENGIPDRQSRDIQLRVLSPEGSPITLRPASSASTLFGVSARNASARVVSWVEIGIVELDVRGRLVFAVDLPLSVHLGPAEAAGVSMLERFEVRPHLSKDAVRTAFLCVRAVRFEDGSWWAPDVHRAEFANLPPAVLSVVGASSIRSRLAALFRHAGIDAVKEDLRHGAQ